MKVVQYLFAAALTMAVVWTFYGILDRVQAVPSTEGFADPSGASLQTSIQNIQLQNPTDSDAIQAHKTLLRYTKANFGKGIAIITNITNQFYGPGLTIRKDIDPSALLTNYTNPLQGP